MKCFSLRTSAQSCYRKSQMRSLAISTVKLSSLQEIADALNAGTHPKLLELINAWKDSGPNLQKMWASDPTLQRTWQAAIRVTYCPSESGRADLRLELQPVDDYGAMLKRYYHRRDPEEAQKLMRAELEDYRLFVSLTLQPRWEDLAGPCDRCHKYFVKKRTTQKVYCSRRCGNAATARIRTTEQRRQEHKKRLERARKAGKLWKPKVGIDWKLFVSGKTGLSSKWLTRAINRGELRNR